MEGDLIQTTTTPQAHEIRRIGIACGVGTAVERYDFFIYGTAAATVLVPQFFPQISQFAGQLAAFATFALGFVALPLGGIVMGHFGDRLGRKSMLVYSLILMGAATFAIGLLPSYAQIGIWAPISLVLLRFLQGFALGGEWGAAVLMSVEHAPRNQHGLYGGLVAMGLPTGLVLANLVFLLTSLAASPAQFIAWAWRLPFLLSAVLIAIGILVRLGVSESPAFAEIERQHAQPRLPIAALLARHWRTVLIAAGSLLSSGTLGYIATVYLVGYATQHLGLSLTTIMAVLVISALILALSIAMFAIWSDRWGRRRIMIAGLVALLLWSAIFFPLIDTGSVALIALAQWGMMFLQGLYLACQPAVFAEIFPVTVRYSGASLSQTTGLVLGGALAPFIAATLYGITGNTRAITVYLVALALVSLLCGLGLRGLKDSLSVPTARRGG